MRNYLRELRKGKNITQQEIADCIGIASNYYSMIENGERQQKISLDLLFKLSKALDVPLEIIISEEIMYRKVNSNVS